MQIYSARGESDAQGDALGAPLSLLHSFGKCHFGEGRVLGLGSQNFLKALMSQNLSTL
jgi:hypothetical protein